MGNLAQQFVDEIAEVLSDRTYKYYVLRDRLLGALGYALELGYGTVAEQIQNALEVIDRIQE
ncbi:MAG: hypothetical protein K6U88_13155 [Dehalococcoidia bacterium]|nr:hypothetical protein [Dehalococcoidia bacterium]